jgi:hypothetical protein
LHPCDGGKGLGKRIALKIPTYAKNGRKGGTGRSLFLSRHLGRGRPTGDHAIGLVRRGLEISVDYKILGASGNAASNRDGKQKWKYFY